MIPRVAAPVTPSFVLLDGYVTATRDDLGTERPERKPPVSSHSRRLTGNYGPRAAVLPDESGRPGGQSAPRQGETEITRQGPPARRRCDRRAALGGRPVCLSRAASRCHRRRGAAPPAPAPRRAARAAPVRRPR